ncbi:hypothetical protein J6590_065538 [Homalodisca vitripennis]|nr:hypothetical protein J6590_065533 [Homalodisca vitripennis]KAG8310359.1 hypothetical protein J6590_065538 [Homalodisca vitripennis]
MSVPQDIRDTVDHPQSVPLAIKGRLLLLSPTFLAVLLMDMMPPTQPRIIPLYIDYISDWHTYAAALHRLTGEDFSARC